MLTRAEQMMKLLEEAFNALVIKVTKSVAEGSTSSSPLAHARQLRAVTAALTYLRTAIPNPDGKCDPTQRTRKLVL
jgi:hypothetical protein